MLLAPITAGPASIVDSSRHGEQYLNLLEALEKDEAGGVALNLRCLAEQLRQITPRLRDQENQVVTMLSSLRDANKVISLRGTLVDNNDYKEFTDALSDYQKQLIAYDIQLEAEMKRQESRPKMKEAKIDQLRSKVVKMIKTSCRSDVNERDNDSKVSKFSCIPQRNKKAFRRVNKKKIKALSIILFSNDDPTLLDVKQITKSRLPHHQESRERLSTRTVQDDKLDEVAPDKQPVASNDDSPKVPFDLNLPKQTTLIACAKEKRSDRGTQDPASSWFRFAYGSRILCCLLFLSACFCSFHIVNVIYSSIITAVDDCEAANTLCKRFNTCCFSICGANRLNILLSKLITINIENNIG
uniref:Uncharacterized protein n=1 Tax=Romanomermis culicivorax TaxID=13658 RepID=A0A915KNK8_ROMCU